MSQLIKLEKFSIEQLPELKGKKEQVKKEIEKFPLIAEIVDSKSYEDAKKSRTGVKTLRTGLQKESKMVLGKIKEHILNRVSVAYDEITNEVIEEERKRQEPIDVYEAELERKRQEKAEQERIRIEAIKNSIEDWYASWADRVSMLTFDKIQEVKEHIDESIANFDVKSLEEFDILFDDKKSLLENVFKAKVDELIKEQEIIESQRILAIKTQISEWHEKRSRVIDQTNDLESLEKEFLSFQKEDGIHCGEFQSEFAEKRASLISRFESKIQAIKTELKQKAEQEEIRLKNERILDKQKELRIKEVGELHPYFNNFEYIREMDDVEYEDELLKAKQNKQEADELAQKEKERHVKELEILRAETLEPYKEFLPDLSLNLGIISQSHFDQILSEVKGKKEHQENLEARIRRENACNFLLENGFEKSMDYGGSFWLHKKGAMPSSETLVGSYVVNKMCFKDDSSLEEFKTKVLEQVELSELKEPTDSKIIDVDYEEVKNIEVIEETQAEEGFVQVPYSMFKAFPCDSNLGAETRKMYFKQIQK
jgi:hypothetical protein